MGNRRLGNCLSGKLSPEKLSDGKKSAGKVSLEKCLLGKCTTGKLASGKLSWNLFLFLRTQMKFMVVLLVIQPFQYLILFVYHVILNYYNS